MGFFVCGHPCNPMWIGAGRIYKNLVGVSLVKERARHQVEELHVGIREEEVFRVSSSARCQGEVEVLCCINGILRRSA